MLCTIATRIHIFPLCSLFFFISEHGYESQSVYLFFPVLCVYLARVVYGSSEDRAEYLTPTLEVVEGIKPKPTKGSHSDRWEGNALAIMN